MKPLTLFLLLSVALFSCNTKKDSNTPLPPKALKPIPENGILAQWQNPHIVVYQYTDDSTDRYTTYMRIFGQNGFAFDTVLFNDGTVKIDSLTIDTITFSNGLFPEMVFTWHSSGSHNNGPGKGGWDLKLKSMAIWDINVLKNIFYTDTYVYGWSSERQHPDDTLIDPEKDLLAEASTETATVTIDTAQKIITLEFVHTYHDSGAWSQEVYRYKNGTFVSDDGDEDEGYEETPLP